jgi:autotransporter-associated beta strand protein
VNCFDHYRCGRNSPYWTTRLYGRGLGVKTGLVVVLALLVGAVGPATAQQRVLGTDISYWNSAISQANWDTAYSTGNRKFAQLRATRGGTTGLDQVSGTPGGGSVTNLSRRYDDPRFVQNLIRATASGLHVGPYHFGRPEIIAATPNSDGSIAGVDNNGTDEANHFIQMAGAWMRPGYVMPMYDMEAGQGRGGDTLAQFAIDFSARIYAVMQIRPCIYINGSYSSTLQGATQARRDALAKPATYTPSVVGPAYPMLWDAYYTTALDLQTANPHDGYSGFYGPWDDYGATHPWTFWQHLSTVAIAGFPDTTCDSDVSHGDIEYIRNYLVPAVWWNDSSGDWSTLTNWNSGQTPVAPVTPADQAPPYATGGLPTARLPGAAGSGPTSGQYDTVILERPNTNITVTLSSGTHNIRKLYMRETLNITGGSLTINYDPTYRADNSTAVLHGGPISAQFSGPVALSNSASLSVHTLQVDTNRVFTLAGGTLTVNTIKLMPHTSVPAKILVSGDVSINPLANATATITNGTGTGSPGFMDLGGGTRSFIVGNGTNDIDLSLSVTVAAGALTKTGPGTMRLTGANTYAGGTTVSSGRLLVNNSTGSGTGTGGVTVNAGTLGGTGTASGVVTLNSGGTIAPGTPSAIGGLKVSSAPTLLGTNFMRIDRNGGTSLADKLTLTAGTLNYGGTLVVTNVGAALLGGEIFTNFSASAYAGAFVSSNLPVLSAGLNWYTGLLTNNGTIRVNRSPVPVARRFTNVAPAVLQIAFTTLTGSATDADADTLTVAGVSLTSTNGIVLATNATSLSYSNRASVTDQFSYTLSDGRGGSATGLVSVVNIGVSPAARFVGLSSTNGNPVHLHFSGTPGWTYYLERSTNLAAWKTIWTNVAPESGAVDYADGFQDLPAPVSPAYYRLRCLP